MLDDDSPMPFGKYKGEPMGEIPANYLDWLHGQDWIEEWPDVLRYIVENRKVIDHELNHGEI